MMKQRDAKATKNKILKVSEDLFSRKGFDGTSVNEIVKTAEVNKALVYYYFENKEGLLNSLIERLMDEIAELMNNRIDQFNALTDVESYKETFKVFLEFILSKKKIIRIAMQESVKSTEKPNFIFEICNKIIETELENIEAAYKNNGFHFEVEAHKFRINEFFTGIMPIITYVIFEDDWMNTYSIDREAFQEKFIESYFETHMKSHFRK